METVEFLDKLNEDFKYLSEAEYTKKIEKLKLEILDVDKYIKENQFKPITNPVTFIRDGSPTPDGLLSNEIFGITKADRAGIFAYIDLHGIFLDPSIYKAWCKIDSRVKSIVHETEKYIINDDGDFEVNEKGKTGIKFLKDNFDKIRFRHTSSNKRDLKIDYIKANKDRMFITKYMVIPAYYRDMNTGGKNIGIGAINKLYVSLLQTVRSLESTLDYGFDDNGAIVGRIQELLVAIYDWFVGNSNSMIAEEGTGISRKTGILRRANMSKTTDNSSRLVLSAPDNRVESVDDLMVTFDKTAVPLAAVIADFYDFVLFHIKKFFENEFGTVSSYMVIDSNGKKAYYTPKDPLIEFSDERIKKELKRFIHGYSDRFIPIEVPLEDGPKGKKFYMTFKGKSKKDNIETESIYDRRLTWLDVFYVAAIEASKDKCIYATRFPIRKCPSLGTLEHIGLF